MHYSLLRVNVNLFAFLGVIPLYIRHKRSIMKAYAH